MSKAYETEVGQVAEGRKFYPLYPRLWKVPGEKCLHVQKRGRDRIALVCARLKGHTDNHLHDVPPEYQK